MKQLYGKVIEAERDVNWSHMIQHNAARLSAIVCLWLICHERLATKERLKHLGLLQDDLCSLCNTTVEDLNHLLIKCIITNNI